MDIIKSILSTTNFKLSTLSLTNSSLSEDMIQTNDFERQVDEIIINVPWGHIAGKWWGSKSVRPILCIHGWQDNAGSFDPLIFQLPDHLSYLAIDLPGHGLSSRIPDGMVYSLEIYFYALLLICDHFQWPKLSLMCHSLGSVISFLYAATFPKKCDMIIGLDTLKPYSDNYKLIHRHFSKGLTWSMKADVRNRGTEEPPSYTYEELLLKVKSGKYMEINDESAPYILNRGILPSTSQRNKYYFTRDSRTKATPIPMMAHDILTMFAKNIISPYCFIKTSAIPVVEKREHYNEIVEIMYHNPHFEVHLVDGDHHIHLNEPSKVSSIISTFINKYRPRHAMSKL